jgi:hypothetical protein
MRILPRPGGGATVFAIGHDLYRLDLRHPATAGARPNTR